MMRYDEQAEISCLGSFFWDNGSEIPYVHQIVEPEDFYITKHQKIYAAMLELFEKEGKIDPILLRDLLDTKFFKGEDILTYLPELMSAVPSEANARRYAIQVKKFSIGRRVIATVQKGISQVETGSSNELFEVISKMVEELLHLDNVSDEIVPIDKLIHQALFEIDNPGTATLKTGFIEIDHLTGGLPISGITVIAAETSVGKTSLATNIAAHVCRRGGRVYFASVETNSIQIAKNCLSMDGEVRTEVHRQGVSNDAVAGRLNTAAAHIVKWDLIIDDRARTFFKIAARARQYHAIKPLTLIVVDYIQFLEVSRAKGESRQEEVSRASRGLKALALDLGVPVIVLSQLNRNISAREDPTPRLSDLRDSGSIEQDADLVLLMFRRKGESGKVTIFIGKNRLGPQGTVNLNFYGGYLRFEDAATIAQEAQRRDYGQ